MIDRKPVKLSDNRVWRLYFGGKLLDEFRGVNGFDGNFPEDWIASVVTANNPERENKPENEGLSKTENGEYLRDIINSAPEMYLSKKHIEKHGENFGVLTKFLDSAERLPIQVHPDKTAAETLFHSDYGKTEAWYILNGRKINGEEPYILLGFKEDVTKDKLKELFDRQDIDTISALMNKITVKPGDVFLIEGGTPHAIGPGCFLIEIQEPTDYTISLEKHNTLGEKMPDFLCHMGLGFDKMFNCFNYIKYSYDEVVKKYKIKPQIIDSNKDFILTQLISYNNTPCFSLRKLDIKKDFVRINPECLPSALVCIDGEGAVNNIEIKKGESMFMPACINSIDFRTSNGFTLIECLPPC
ncbi:MAG: class I mannose-6-phosphate isomerase [Clostridia bacterium]|nr:class I mannose-6-phosphate isomerase [Clostridia bacterium]